MQKLLILSLVVLAVSAQNSSDCLPNQYWNMGSKSCQNEQGYCRPASGALMYDSCDSCTPCPATGPCPGNQPCYQNAYCNNLGSFCGGPYTNCTADQEYSVEKQACVDKVMGFCQPANGSWIVNSCSVCQQCSGAGETCPGYTKGKTLCVKQLSCGTWADFCENKTPTPTPTPTPSTNNTHGCLPNQFWDVATKACLNEQGWCKPSASSWMYDACDSCVPCPKTGACPGNQQCVQQAYCSNLGSYCGGPYTVCQAHQTYSVTKKACVDQVKGWCVPSGTWLVDACTNCQECWGQGENCPGYTNGKTSCATSLNCGNWSTWCSATTQE